MDAASNPAAQSHQNRMSQLPGFTQITAHIQAQAQENQEVLQSNLRRYEIMRAQFESQGYSFEQICLLRAFGYELIQVCPPLRLVNIVRKVSLFCSMLLFRELELVVWASFCRPETMRALLSAASNDDKAKQDQSQIRLVLDHLLSTAFYTKRQLTGDATYEAIQAFFDKNFLMFKGKHTDWLLLNEPDQSQLTPLSQNLRYQELIGLYKEKIRPASQEDDKPHDFNQLVQEILDRRVPSEFNTIKDRFGEHIDRRRHQKQTRKKRDSTRKAIIAEMLTRRDEPDEINKEDSDPFNLLDKQTQKPADELPVKKTTEESANPEQKDQDVSTLIIKEMVQQTQQTKVIPASNLNDSIIWNNMQSKFFDLKAVMSITQNQTQQMQQQQYCMQPQTSFVHPQMSIAHFDQFLRDSLIMGSGGNQQHSFLRRQGSLQQFVQGQQQQSGGYAMHFAPGHTNALTCVTGGGQQQQNTPHKQSSLLSSFRLPSILHHGNQLNFQRLPQLGGGISAAGAYTPAIQQISSPQHMGSLVVTPPRVQRITTPIAKVSGADDQQQQNLLNSLAAQTQSIRRDFEPRNILPQLASVNKKPNESQNQK